MVTTQVESLATVLYAFTFQISKSANHTEHTAWAYLKQHLQNLIPDKPSPVTIVPQLGSYCTWQEYTAD